jgi:hypothetical protein
VTQKKDTKLSGEIQNVKTRHKWIRQAVVVPLEREKSCMQHMCNDGEKQGSNPLARACCRPPPPRSPKVQTLFSANNHCRTPAFFSTGATQFLRRQWHRTDPTSGSSGRFHDDQRRFSAGFFSPSPTVPSHGAVHNTTHIIRAKLTHNTATVNPHLARLFIHHTPTKKKGRGASCPPHTHAQKSRKKHRVMR